ncbi:unnamed protein product [Cercospora beticola]|nr:unnamed protein product [Cercospora beticola]
MLCGESIDIELQRYRQPVSIVPRRHDVGASDLGSRRSHTHLLLHQAFRASAAQPRISGWDAALTPEWAVQWVLGRTPDVTSKPKFEPKLTNFTSTRRGSSQIAWHVA